MNQKSEKLQGQRVILGLSGGVDSAVAAWLLKQSGADVQALHMTNWEDDDGYCTAAEDLQDARKICDELGLVLHHVNFAREYRERVFSYFLDEYKSGRTPNPDVLCNREIKFGVFLEHAKRLGADKIATGHYARSEHVDGSAQLWKARDLSKDQSYFLHAVSEEALADTLFPLGELMKTEVRSIARDLGLVVHDKKDSTGICFIGERPFREFLATYLPANPGPIKTTGNQVIGEHGGLMYYTLGQRQGLGIGGMTDAADEPWYVADKRLEDNALIVVQGDHPALYSSALEANKATWIGTAPAKLSAGQDFHCKVKLRYRQEDQDCVVQEAGEGRLKLRFPEPQLAVTPGQFAVFYDGQRCLGGAVIDRSFAAEECLSKTG